MAGGFLTRRRGVSGRRSLGLVAVAALVLAVQYIPSSAAASRPVVPGEVPEHNITVAAQAQPLECFQGVGVMPTPTVNGQCPNGGKPRTNEGYLWGVAKDDQQTNIWFGTSTNPFCNGMPGYATLLTAAGLNPVDQPFTSDSNTCEFAQGWYAKNNIPPSAGVWGDARVVHIYQYNIASGTLTDRSPVNDDHFIHTAGIRSAGGLNGVMLLGGVEGSTTDPQAGGTVSLFAFRQSDGAYLGSRRFPEYNNVKNFFAHNGQLYVGMALTTPEAPGSSPGPTTGVVLKWTGA